MVTGRMRRVRVRSSRVLGPMRLDPGYQFRLGFVLRPSWPVGQLPPEPGTRPKGENGRQGDRLVWSWAEKGSVGGEKEGKEGPEGAGRSCERARMARMAWMCPEMTER